MEARSITKHFKENWILYAFAAQLIINYTITSQTLQEHNRRIIVLENKATLVEATLSEIKVQLSAIQTSLKFIEKSI